jgi:biopolymer transport protein ExbD
MAGGGLKTRVRPVKRLKIEAPKSDINVTPLVDVCLVLLIIFMVITPLLARGKDVPLPKTLNYEEAPDKNQPIVAIDAKGMVFFDKERVAQLVPGVPLPNGERMWKVDDTDTLELRVEDAFKRMDEAGATGDDGAPLPRKVFFKGDASLPYGEAYAVIMALKEMGMPVVDLGVNELKQGAAAPAQ